MKVNAILDSIDQGAMALPKFQRGYVWNRAQVRGLMHSLYHRHPVGGLLVWLTGTEEAEARGDHPLQPGYVKLLLDGQQRVTSLYGIVRGEAPPFFEGNANAFTGLRFHLEDESFEFYAPIKMADDPLWVDVTSVMSPDGLREALGAAMTAGMGEGAATGDGDAMERAQRHVFRLNQLNTIRDVEFHIDEVTGQDKTLDVVVDIFNRVNSGGTKLSKGDLALARICAQWPGARDEMNRLLSKWRTAGFSFSLDWLLRSTNAILRGRAEFSALEGVETIEFREGLKRAEKAIDKHLNLIGGRLGLDHGSVLGGASAFPLMNRFLDQRGGAYRDHEEQDAILYWYVQSFLWGRYASSTETTLNVDLVQISPLNGAVARLIAQLRQNRGDLTITANDFIGWSRGSRFYPLLYMLTRVGHARDWGSGVELRQSLLGYQAQLELHHIFPKARLYKLGHSRPEVNALANFSFLTMETNNQISDEEPASYLPRFQEMHPGAIESHWIPSDPDLWKLENYHDFLDERRRLLAAAANQFLGSLFRGEVPDAPEDERDIVGLGAERAANGHGADDEEQTIHAVNEWVESRGFACGAVNFELSADDGSQVAVFDLAWPEGLQPGLTDRVALLLNEAPQVEQAAGKHGYRFFTSGDDLIAYVQTELEDALADGSGHEGSGGGGSPSG